MTSSKLELPNGIWVVASKLHEHSKLLVNPTSSDQFHIVRISDDPKRASIKAHALQKIRSYTQKHLSEYPGSIPPWSIIRPDSLKRKSTDYNGMELLVSILLGFKGVNSVTSVIDLLDNPSRLSSRVRLNSSEELGEYTKDLKSKSKLIEGYLETFRKEMSGQKWEVSQVFLTGKTNRIEEIEELNREVPDAKRNAKADVYFKTTDGMYVGISVKESRQATKSNASVEKLLGEEGKRLRDIRVEWGKKIGFLEKPKEEEKEAFRKKFNPLFYDRNNLYWSQLRQSLSKNPTLSQELSEMLFSYHLPYSMFEFDGTGLHSLNADKDNDKETTRLVEYEPYYHYGDELTGKPRQAAKLFYQLSVGKKNYKVEIRFKGSFNASPQFHIHEE